MSERFVRKNDAWHGYEVPPAARTFAAGTAPDAQPAPALTSDQLLAPMVQPTAAPEPRARVAASVNLPATPPSESTTTNGGTET